MESKQLAIPKRGDIIQGNNLYVFYRLAIKIYEEQGYGNFSSYFLKLQTFKQNMDEHLLKYYCYNDIKYMDGVKQIANDLVYLIDSFKIDIYQSFLGTDSENIRQINDYFLDKKSNINNIDPKQNGNLCVSKLQVDWAMILHQIENYNEKIKLDINESIKKPSQSISIWGKIYKAIMPPEDEYQKEEGFQISIC